VLSRRRTKAQRLALRDHLYSLGRVPLTARFRPGGKAIHPTTTACSLRLRLASQHSAWCGSSGQSPERGLDGGGGSRSAVIRHRGRNAGCRASTELAVAAS